VTGHRQRAGVVSVVAMLLGGLPSLGHAQTVNVWLTTNSQSAKLQSQASLSFGISATATNPIVVDETRTYQEIEGFGASMTDSSAYLLHQVATPAARAAAMTNLFTRTGTGIGLSFLRNPMGGSDLARFHYSYDDLPAGQTDPTLAGFSIAHDLADIVPLMQQARALNPQLVVMATPWSPPGWMKTSGSLIGGALLASAHAPFANYFVKYIQAYEAAGIPIDYVSLQNEPLYVPGDYPGMSMDAATQLAVLKLHLLPALTSAGLSTKALVYDHNWDRPDYPDSVLADPAIAESPRVAGIAWHGYGGTPGAMLALHDKYPR
jgi:glucosylceramidase